MVDAIGPTDLVQTGASFDCSRMNLMVNNMYKTPH